MWVVPSDRDRTYFRQNCSQEFLAGYLAGFNAQLVCLLNGAAIYISDPLPGCTHDGKGISPPRRSPRLSRIPVAGIVDKGAEASAMTKRLIVCCDGT